MLTLVQASQIVRDCIREAVGWAGPIEASNKLNEVGVLDDDNREALNDEIVTNPAKGVQSEGHQIDPDALTFSTETKVFELRDEVFEKAVPGEGFMRALAEVFDKK